MLLLLNNKPIMSIVYVPLFIYGRDKYEYDAKTFGVFVNQTDAINSLIKYLVENDNLNYISYIENELEEDLEEDEENEKINKQRFVEHLISYINGDYEKLLNACNKYDDSYYKNGWTIRIDQYETSEAEISKAVLK